MTRQQAIEQLHRATAVYTRAPVVQRLLARLGWPNGGGRLLEPGCGDGAFLVAAVARLLQHEPRITPGELVDRVVAFEVHPGAAAEARDALDGALRLHGWPGEIASATARLVVRNEDYLTTLVPGGFRAIAGNFPYLRKANVPRELLQEYLPVVPAYAQSDLLHAFLAKAITNLEPGGELAMVASDRWLFNASAAELRARVGERLALRHVERLDAASAFYRPKVRRSGTPARVHPVEVILAEDGEPLTSAPIYPGAQPAPEGTRPLADVARVRLAPWLGGRGAFVVDAETAARLEGADLVPCVDGKDIAEQLARPTKWAIRTRPGVEPPASVKAHLQRRLPEVSERARQVSDWWLPPERCDTHDLSEERILVPRIAPTIRTHRVPPGVLPIDHNLTVIGAGTATLDEIERALHAPHVHEWLAPRAGRLEDGHLSITTTLLRGVPVFL